MVITRPKLPINLLSNQGTILESFQNVADWSALANLTLSPDTIHFKEGVQGIKFLSNVLNGTSSADKVVNIDMSAMTTITFWIYVEDITAFVNGSLKIYLSNDSSWSKYFQLVVTTDKLVNGMNKIRFRKTEFTLISSPKWSNPIQKIRLKFNSSATGYASVTFCGMYASAENIPKVIITVDDVFGSTYSEIFSYLNPKGLKFTAFVSGSGIDGGGGNLTSAQLQEMYNAGNDISNHTFNHLDLTSLSLSDAQNQITLNRDWLISQGFTRSADFLAYPMGQYNDAIVSALPSLGVKLARIANGSMSPYTYPPVDNIYLIPIGYAMSTVPLSAIKAMVDLAISRKGTIFLLFHQIITPTTDIYSWTVEDFRALINYLLERKVDIVTISEWYRQLLNPRK